MASIHSVLKRMKDADEIKSKEAKDGSGTRYYYAAESKLPTGSVMVNTARIWADANAASNMSKDMQAFVKAAEALTTSDAIKQLGRTLQSVQEMGNFVGQVEQTHMLKPEGKKK